MSEVFDNFEPAPIKPLGGPEKSGLPRRLPGDKNSGIFSGPRKTGHTQSEITVAQPPSRQDQIEDLLSNEEPTPPWLQEEYRQIMDASRSPIRPIPTMPIEKADRILDQGQGLLDAKTQQEKTAEQFPDISPHVFHADTQISQTPPAQDIHHLSSKPNNQK